MKNIFELLNSFGLHININENTSPLFLKAVGFLNFNLIDGTKDFLNNIRDLFTKYINFLDTLSLHQLGSLANLLAAIFVLTCLFSVVYIIYSDLLLKYLKIEEKYPKIQKIIKLRRKFQHFYLLINFLLIILTLIAVIIVNYTALTN